MMYWGTEATIVAPGVRERAEISRAAGEARTVPVMRVVKDRTAVSVKCMTANWEKIIGEDFWFGLLRWLRCLVFGVWCLDGDFGGDC